MGAENNTNNDARATVSPDTSHATAVRAHHERDTQDEASHLLSIDEVARRTELSKPTLRFYEQKGLVAPPARLPGRFRKHNSQDLEQLERVKQLRDLLGLSLTEIEETLKLDRSSSTKNTRGWRNRRARNGMRRMTRWS